MQESLLQYAWQTCSMNSVKVRRILLRRSSGHPYVKAMSFTPIHYFSTGVANNKAHTQPRGDNRTANRIDTKKSKPIEKSTDKNTTQTKPTQAPTKKVTPKKASIVTKEDAKKVKGPPTKRKAPPSPEASQEEEPSGSEYDPGNSNSNSDNSAAECTPKRGRTKGQPNRSVPKRQARGS